MSTYTGKLGRPVQQPNGLRIIREPYNMGEDFELRGGKKKEIEQKGVSGSLTTNGKERKKATELSLCGKNQYSRIPNGSRGKPTDSYSSIRDWLTRNQQSRT